MSELINPESQKPENILEKEVYQKHLLPLLSEENVQKLIAAEKERSPEHEEYELLGTRLTQLSFVIQKAGSDGDISMEDSRILTDKIDHVQSVSELVKLAVELREKLEAGKAE